MKKRFAASAMILAMSAATVLSPLTAFAEAEEQELNIAIFQGSSPDCVAAASQAAPGGGPERHGWTRPSWSCTGHGGRWPPRPWPRKAGRNTGPRCRRWSGRHG